LLNSYINKNASAIAQKRPKEDGFQSSGHVFENMRAGIAKSSGSPY